MVSLVEYLAVGVIDDAGLQVGNGSVYAYEAGTTTAKTLFQERELTNPYPNPAPLDSVGKLVAFADARLKLVIVNSSGVTIRTIDNVGIGAGDIKLGDLAAGAVDSTALGDSSVTATKMAANAVGSAAVQDGAVTSTKMGASNKATSASCGSALVSISAYADVTNLSCSITVTGLRPVRIQLIPDGGGSVSYLNCPGSSLVVAVVRTPGAGGSSATLAEFNIGQNNAGFAFPVSSISHEDDPTVGTWVYKIQAKSVGNQGSIVNAKLRIREV